MADEQDGNSEPDDVGRPPPPEAPPPSDRPGWRTGVTGVAAPGSSASSWTDEVGPPPEGTGERPWSQDAGAEVARPDRDAGAHKPAGPARRSPVRRILADARFAWLVAAVAVLGLIALAFAAVPALTAERERAEVRDRAEVIAARVTTFEGESIEEWVAETRALATGAYARQLDDVFDQELRDALRENEVESVGTIQRSFVQSIEDDEAEVFVLARQSSVNAQREQPVEDELRIEIQLRREDGEWLASDIAVLGPQQRGAVPAPAPDEDE